MSKTVSVCLALFSMHILIDTIEDMVIEKRNWVFLGTVANYHYKSSSNSPLITLKRNIQITQ